MYGHTACTIPCIRISRTKKVRKKTFSCLTFKLNVLYLYNVLYGQREIKKKIRSSSPFSLSFAYIILLSIRRSASFFPIRLDAMAKPFHFFACPFLSKKKILCYFFFLKLTSLYRIRSKENRIKIIYIEQQRCKHKTIEAFDIQYVKPLRTNEYNT